MMNNSWPDSLPVELENWPWRLKVYTLGRFEVVRDGKSLHFAGKAQQKPLDLLRALIALGGRKIGEETAAGALWPSADGDQQHQVLATTLHRLRKLLGLKEAIEFRDGQLSVNAGCCWVDAWAFERLAGQAEDAWQSSGYLNGQGLQLALAACALYKGSFLVHLQEMPWTIRLRQRLTSKFLRLVDKLGSHLERQGYYKEAAEHYQKALEADPLVEEFYQRLILCYNHQGLRAEALATYNRCRQILAALLNIEPAPRTLAIYNSVRTGLKIS